MILSDVLKKRIAELIDPMYIIQQERAMGITKGFNFVLEQVMEEIEQFISKDCSPQKIIERIPNDCDLNT